MIDPLLLRYIGAHFSMNHDNSQVKADVNRTKNRDDAYTNVPSCAAAPGTVHTSEVDLVPSQVLHVNHTQPNPDLSYNPSILDGQTLHINYFLARGLPTHRHPRQCIVRTLMQHKLEGCIVSIPKKLMTNSVR
jgi:hypothetical protein